MEENNVRKVLSDNLHRLMVENNIDQKELAEAIGVTQPTVSNWLQQIKYPRIKRIQQLADYFNVPKSKITEPKENVIESDTLQAAHFNKDDLTEDEIKQVENFIQFLKENRNK
ncbi:helix-turn-helix domain-containing protein [Staphylococcus epidermidis]|uniref:helix-turn-helix domain-containing protein n=1 Tax=Staphylococcus epidermidis TaxID=1282 RepID=UPI0020966A6C|nr:helix-turn-helix transcriptional regulator [Staphylococcus epidermidis]MCG2181424.1 helix-turn-helix domain-containing protein [Staphylococcus epidermidis]MCO6310334.1 helix-turn-helix domain-containing protein [Staphylococcus epidermidis]